MPRLRCDYFKHYMKTHRFKFKRVTEPLPSHYGPYILLTDKQVYIGEYDKLLKLSKRLGGVLRRLNIVDDTF